MKTRSRSCVRPMSDARTMQPATLKPSFRRSPRTLAAPGTWSAPAERNPATFSMRTNHGRAWAMIRRAGLQRSRSSVLPPRRPAKECGWQGIPPMRPSTRPRNWRPGKVRTSLQTAAGAMRPSSICATSEATAKLSLSTQSTVRACGIASSTARSRPPPPVQRLRMLRRWGRRARSLTHAPYRKEHQRLRASPGAQTSRLVRH